MSYQKIMACTFDAGADGELLSASDVYAAEMYLNEIEILGSGIDGTVAVVGHRAHFGVASVGKLEDDGPRVAGNTFGQGTNTGSQYAQVTVGTTAANSPGVVCRGSTDGTAYSLTRQSADTVRRMFKWTSPSAVTVLATVSSLTALAPGDILRIRASGSTITGDRNGVDEISAVDATYASGTGGVTVQGNNGAACATAFEAGVLSSRLPTEAERASHNTVQIQRRARKPRVVVVSKR